MTRMYTGEALERWQKAKQMQLGMTTSQCMKTGSIEVAACQIAAMNGAGEDMKKGLPDLLSALHREVSRRPEGAREAGGASHRGSRLVGGLRRGWRVRKRAPVRPRGSRSARAAPRIERERV